MIDKLAIIGVGLIGGSAALALKEEGVVKEVVGCGRGEANLIKAQSLGVIDHYTHDVGAAVKGADMVLLSVPLGAMRDTLSGMRGQLTDHAVVTDAGSVKCSVVNDVKAVFGEIPGFFVPGHPIAGTERSGAEAAFAELYRNRRVILTPLQETDKDALLRVERMWQQCGADVVQMTVEHHDEVLAATSHLPHMLAFTLVDSLARMKENDEIFRFAAGGFRDFTRIASSNPVMWRDICIANQGYLNEMLTRFAGELHELAALLQSGDETGLLEIFQRAKKARDRYVDGVNKS
ncbi:MAG: prephenate dehydrogenase/arogenate dehydrogenase family protein [Candidatus Thiodiazotropha endolucinida]|nr:prephenate dehydrogenase/arogenate dehydrogenase family protein [Candidatus Thiodiazotropha taylori]MCW4224827.1 prephenate dehydrogenase/arogenate dehydrogenase family protein [Candidatus Thiodiazotropha endolucinida]MCG7882576.1 prephenate dehydrogenase/arogenate dehydrogenase family protein [Candidatus Thiodiazotropha taylori]MCG7886400.1 prephenate dehydrogenase/arogenate dehydrogenase family protein [Candidatus Thiodiazotropha taylori]MCG7888966.1 prephenate dehydrogenase/arogenate dehy